MIIKTEEEIKAMNLPILKHWVTEEAFVKGYLKAHLDIVESASENESELFNSLMSEWSAKYPQALIENDNEFIGHTALHFFRRGSKNSQLSSEKKYQAKIAELERSVKSFRLAYDAEVSDRVKILEPRIRELESKLSEAKEKIRTLEFHLYEISESGLAVRSMLNNKEKEIELLQKKLSIMEKRVKNLRHGCEKSHSYGFSHYFGCPTLDHEEATCDCGQEKTESIVRDLLLKDQELIKEYEELK